MSEVFLTHVGAWSILIGEELFSVIFSYLQWHGKYLPVTFSMPTASDIFCRTTAVHYGSKPPRIGNNDMQTITTEASGPFAPKKHCPSDLIVVTGMPLSTPRHMVSQHTTGE
jgi:hypothetical protein